MNSTAIDLFHLLRNFDFSSVLFFPFRRWFFISPISFFFSDVNVTFTSSLTSMHFSFYSINTQQTLSIYLFDDNQTKKTSSFLSPCPKKNDQEILYLHIYIYLLGSFSLWNFYTKIRCSSTSRRKTNMTKKWSLINITKKRKEVRS